MNTVSKPAGWLAAAAVLIGGVVTPFALAAPASADVAAKGGDFVSVSPRQSMLNTKSGIGAPVAKLTAGKTITAQAAGVAGVPTTGVRAVLLDLTALSPSTTTSFKVYPSGGTVPGTTVLTSATGVSESTSVVADLGADGKISFYNSAGTVDLSAVVEGYFTTATASSGPGGFVPVPTTRIMSTSQGTGGVPVATVAVGKSVTPQLTGGVIPAGAYAVYGTIRVGSATAAGSLLVDPPGVSDGSTVMYYGTSTTTSGAMLRLSSTGQATFTNHNGSAVNLWFDVQGYIAPDTAHGYGYRSAPSTSLVASVSVAAGANYDFQVGGRGGIPTRGAGAAVLNLSGRSSTAAGYLNAYPADGAAPPSVAMLSWNASQTRNVESFVRLGATGRVRLHNYGTAAVTVSVVSRGWFDTGEAHDVAIEQHAATSVLQAVSGGPVDASYINAGGSLFHGVAAADTLDQAQWSVVPSNLEAFTGQPSIVRLPSGNLLVSVLHANNGEVWNFQVPAGQSSWTPSFTRTAGVMASPPVSANLPDGNVLTFAVDSDGALWVLPATGSTYWQQLGAAGLVGSPTVVTTSTGVQVVGRTTSGTVTTAGYVDGVLSAWTDLGGAGVTDKTAVVVNNGPRVRVVARQADGSIVSKLQNLNGSWPASWTQAGSAGVSPTFVGGPAVGIDLGSGTDPGTGKAFVLARGAADGYLYQLDESGVATGTWGEWYLVPGQSTAAGTDPTVTSFGGSGNNFHWIASYLDINNSPKLLHAAVV